MGKPTTIWEKIRRTTHYYNINVNNLVYLQIKISHVDRFDPNGRVCLFHFNEKKNNFIVFYFQKI